MRLFIAIFQPVAAPAYLAGWLRTTTFSPQRVIAHLDGEEAAARKPPPTSAVSCGTP
jgi:hypothetical protein